MTEQDSKSRYERLLRCIRFNSVDVGKPCCHEASVRLALTAHGDVEVEEYERSLRAACERGDVVSADGWVCYPVDVQMARDAASFALDSAEDTPREFVKGLNQWIANYSNRNS